MQEFAMDGSNPFLLTIPPPTYILVGFLVALLE
jgi:hypothetical protein